MNKQEFEYHKELINLQHKYKTEEIKLEAELQKVLIDTELKAKIKAIITGRESRKEFQRIKDAEIRKHLERKQDLKFMESYMDDTKK